ncbi:MAG: carbonic anhydrase [Bdellovibrionota bacterium]
MKKLLHGIVHFRENVRPEYRKTFAHLALEQKPDTLMVACSDSRVVPNLFASSDPGDMFVVRNVGNLIPPCEDGSPHSEQAAIEFALKVLPVTDVIVCGHSECGAVRALLDGPPSGTGPGLRSWLDFGKPALAPLKAALSKTKLPPHNCLSQLNVLEQIEHLRTYPAVREREQQGKLRLHAWWFDIAEAQVLSYDEASKSFLVLDEKRVKELLRELEEG